MNNISNMSLTELENLEDAIKERKEYLQSSSNNAQRTVIAKHLYNAYNELKMAASVASQYGISFEFRAPNAQQCRFYAHTCDDSWYYEKTRGFSVDNNAIHDLIHINKDDIFQELWYSSSYNC